MQMFRNTIKLDAETAAQVGEDFWQKWKETVSDMAETTRKSAAAKSVVDVWSAQVGFGMRNAQRWCQWQPCAAADMPAADEPEKPASAAGGVEAEPGAKPEPLPVEVQPETAEPKPAEAETRQLGLQAEPVSEPAPQPPRADDLTRIRGIGPAIERKLLERGLTTFRQIADLSEAEQAALDDALDFKGRIERDEWVAQARKLSERGNA